MIRWILLIMLAATPALAGPWLRAEGTGFSATTAEVAPSDRHGIDLYNSVYAEYGLTPRLTLGLDGGGDTAGNGNALVFLRFPLREGRHSRMAAELALGARWSLTELTPLVRPGLSWGRGIALFGYSGWTTLDATLTIPGGGGTILPKLDAMIGLNQSDRLKLMLGLTLERPGTTLSPSFAYRVWDKYHLTLGLKLRSAGAGEHCLTLGFWQDF